MIRLIDVTKTYKPRASGAKVVLDNVTVEFPTGRNVGIFGMNGAGKSTLIRLLAGAEKPDRGHIIRDGSVSFPLGFSSIFHPDLTGRENVEFVARVYGLVGKEVALHVEDFAELREYFDIPVKTYSSGMLSKLAFGLCLAIDFDVYLIDEITEVGDGRFRQKALAAFRDRMLSSDVIIVSHNIDTIRDYCDMGAVLHNGKIEFFETITEAQARFRAFLS
jgi:capsular polysaccharide transport system ATP-binding protein